MTQPDTVSRVRLPVFQEVHELTKLHQPEFRVFLRDGPHPKVPEPVVSVTEGVPVNLVPGLQRVLFRSRGAVFVHAPVSTGNNVGFIPVEAGGQGQRKAHVVVGIAFVGPHLI